MQRNFFEGAEKKVELVVARGALDLRSLGLTFWRRVVESAGAQVLSRISNDACDAYLLSESSLFVFERKVVMITCGLTRLADAVGKMLERIAPRDVIFFAFERKNEVLPQQQPSGFFEDAQALHAWLPGAAYRFGHEDEHHVYLYHRGRPFSGSQDDVTLELLMYGLDDEASRLFDARALEGRSNERRTAALARVLPGYEVDEHLFQPAGYSLNGIRGEHYVAIHVTPQEQGSYASCETNDPGARDPMSTARAALELFRPRAFDVMLFDADGPELEAFDGYEARAHVATRLESGYRVRFASFSRPCATVGEPFRFSLPEARRRQERG